MQKNLLNEKKKKKRSLGIENKKLQKKVSAVFWWIFLCGNSQGKTKPSNGKRLFLESRWALLLGGRCGILLILFWRSSWRWFSSCFYFPINCLLRFLYHNFYAKFSATSFHHIKLTWQDNEQSVSTNPEVVQTKILLTLQHSDSDI